jgi:hypothetical protein
MVKNISLTVFLFGPCLFSSLILFCKNLGSFKVRDGRRNKQAHLTPILTCSKELPLVPRKPALYISASP